MDSRGWVNYKLGEYDRAVADLEVAAGLFDPPYEEVLRHLAQAALKAGRSDKAFETLKTILVMGEYDYVRTALDSLMDARGYSPEDKAGFEESIWETRMAEASDAQAFTLPTLAGESYDFDPKAGRVTVINFMSPT
jgi:tetratricopeptide (TPR) repeat protein